jgi:hypothetical protein
MDTHESQPYSRKRWVFFTGSTALLQGQGLCYVRDYTASSPTGRAATDPSGYRDKRVAVPSNANNTWFAGVTTQGYAAVTGGQWIEIYLPGSICEIQVTTAATVAGTLLTCSASTPDAGAFNRAGLPGRGSALALQTTGTATLNSTDAAPVCASLDGSASIANDGITITKAGLFTTVKAGDKVVVLGGSTTASGAANAVAGIYTVASRTSDNVIVLTAGSAVAAAATIIDIIVYRGAPLILAQLLDGEESGLQETVSLKNNAEVVPAAMKGGTTYVVGGVTSANGTTATLVDGSALVRRKLFILDGAITTGTLKVTATSSNIVTPSMTGGTLGTFAAAASFGIGAAKGYADLLWSGTKWSLIGGLGVTA